MYAMVMRVFATWATHQSPKSFIVNASTTLAELSVKCAAPVTFKRNGNQPLSIRQTFANRVTVIHTQLNVFTAKRLTKTKQVLIFTEITTAAESVLIVCITLKVLIVKNVNLATTDRRKGHLMLLMFAKNAAVALSFMQALVMKEQDIVIVKNSLLAIIAIDVAMVIMTSRSVSRVLVF